MPALRDDELSFKNIGKPEIGRNGYLGFLNRTDLLKKGSTTKGWDGLPSKALESDIYVDHDVELVMRDGVKIYADIYRPANSDEKVPIIVSWSPYGKKYSTMDMLPVTNWKCGVKPSDLSGYEKFEGVDPAYWCPKGYAVASVDQRGSGNSEGYIRLMGEKDSQDGYDAIEALAKMEYCNGKIGMAGNSHLAIIQYFIASLKPPSLAAIAPWDGMGDLYREQFCRGGVFTLSNFVLISTLIYKGPKGVEDLDAMYKRQPYATDPFWADKRADMSKIDIPCFLAGSDVSSIHTMGTLRGWCQIPSKQKWLKWYPWQEWFDFYAVPETMDDLRGFFDRFLKDKQNGWDQITPKVRMAILNHGDVEPLHDIEYENWPVPSTQYTDFSLAQEGKLSPTKVETQSVLAYDSESFESEGSLSFDFKFDKHTRLVGLPKAILYMSTDDHTDMNIFVLLRKLDKEGRVIDHIQVTADRRWIKKEADLTAKDRAGLTAHPGALGILRASRRHEDPSRQWHTNAPFLTHDRDELLTKGEIYELTIGIWHMGVDYQAGESLRVNVSGQSSNYPELKEMNGTRPDKERNIGQHKLHIGGKYPSRIVLPIVPI